MTDVIAYMEQAALLANRQVRMGAYGQAMLDLLIRAQAALESHTDCTDLCSAIAELRATIEADDLHTDED